MSSGGYGAKLGIPSDLALIENLRGSQCRQAEQSSESAEIRDLGEFPDIAL